MWLWVVGIVVLTGVIAVIAVGSGDAVGEAYDDRPDTTVPVGRPLTADDLGDVRFNTAVRGYRMDEVDALLARVRADLLARESDALRREAGGASRSGSPGVLGPPDVGAGEPSDDGRDPIYDDPIYDDPIYDDRDPGGDEPDLVLDGDDSRDGGTGPEDTGRTGSTRAP